LACNFQPAKRNSTGYKQRTINRAYETQTEQTVVSIMDTVIKNKAENIMLIDVAIQADGNATQRGSRKEAKHESYCVEIQRMWNMKCVIIPPTSGANGMITKGLKKNLETIPGKHSIGSPQKTAILGTSHIIRKVLQCEA